MATTGAMAGLADANASCSRPSRSFISSSVDCANAQSRPLGRFLVMKFSRIAVFRRLQFSPAKGTRALTRVALRPDDAEMKGSGEGGRRAGLTVVIAGGRRQGGVRHRPREISPLNGRQDKKDGLSGNGRSAVAERLAKRAVVIPVGVAGRRMTLMARRPGLQTNLASMDVYSTCGGDSGRDRQESLYGHRQRKQ